MEHNNNILSCKDLLNHELRTPLTFILGAAEMAEMSLTDPVLKEKLPEFIKIISTGARELSRVINEILTFEQISNNEVIDTLFITFDINKLIIDLVETLSPVILEKNLKVIYNLSPNLPLLRQDKGKLTEVLLQIISNAIKVSNPGGEIKILSKLEKENEQNIIVSIQDNGPGIDNKYINEIFNPFFQLHNGLNRNLGGLGLGLTISKQLIYKLGGKIEICNNVNNGTIVNIYIPIDKTNIQWDSILNTLLQSNYNKECKLLNTHIVNYTQKFKNYDNISLETLYTDIIKVLIYITENKDPYSFGHAHRVASYAVLIAKEMGLTNEQLAQITMGSLIHDIGKIFVLDTILLKKEPLTSEEVKLIQKHPEAGANLLSHINILKPIIPIVLYHHEHYNGCGYPHKLKGKDIPLLARIVALADVFEALTSDRAYRHSFSTEQAIQTIVNLRETQFDPEIVDIFVKLYNTSKLQYS